MAQLSAHAHGFGAAAGSWNSPSGRRATECVERGPVDVLLLLCVAFLVCVGLVTVYSASALEGHFAYGDEMVFFSRQVQGAALGLVAVIVGMRIDYRVYQRFIWPMMIGSFILLAASIAGPFAAEWNGASRWLRIGPVRFQPAELVKLMTAFYMAYSIAKKGTALRNFAESFIAHGLVFCWFIFALMLQPDFGSSVIVCSVIAVMLFVGRARASWMVALGAVFVVLVVAAISSAEYRMDRVQMWIDPWTYREDTGWQLISAFIALARGGLFGTGFGLGEARLGHVPELYNDFVAASIGEEFGLTGMAVLALAYMALVWRGVAISRRAADSFGAYLALGITMLIGIQAAVNLWVVTGMLPTKGLTLPFVSSGRSSLLILLFAVGVLLNISQANPDVAGERRRQRDNTRRKKASAALRAVAQEERERQMRQHVGGQ